MTRGADPGENCSLMIGSVLRELCLFYSKLSSLFLFPCREVGAGKEEAESKPKAVSIFTLVYILTHHFPEIFFTLNTSFLSY